MCLFGVIYSCLRKILQCRHSFVDKIGGKKLILIDKGKRERVKKKQAGHDLRCKIQERELKREAS